MAKYRIINPVIKTVPAGKQNAGGKYLIAKLQNTMCIWEIPHTYTCFNPLIVEALTPLLSMQNGGIAQENQPIPEELATITGCWVDWQPAQKFYKQHLSDHQARPATPTQAARPAIKAGELVKKGNEPILFTTLRIFCQYYIDEFGEKTWLIGESPEEVGQRAFRNYCIPATEDKTPQTVQQPEVEIVNGQPIQTIQPQFAQNPAVQGAAFSV